MNEWTPCAPDQSAGGEFGVPGFGTEHDDLYLDVTGNTMDGGDMAAPGPDHTSMKAMTNTMSPRGGGDSADVEFPTQVAAGALDSLRHLGARALGQRTSHGIAIAREGDAADLARSAFRLLKNMLEAERAADKAYLEKHLKIKNTDVSERDLSDAIERWRDAASAALKVHAIHRKICSLKGVMDGGDAEIGGGLFDRLRRKTRDTWSDVADNDVDKKKCGDDMQFVVPLNAARTPIYYPPFHDIYDERQYNTAVVDENGARSTVLVTQKDAFGDSDNLHARAAWLFSAYETAKNNVEAARNALSKQNTRDKVDEYTTAKKKLKEFDNDDDPLEGLGAARFVRIRQEVLHSYVMRGHAASVASFLDGSDFSDDIEKSFVGLVPYKGATGFEAFVGSKGVTGTGPVLLSSWNVEAADDAAAEWLEGYHIFARYYNTVHFLRKPMKTPVTNGDWRPLWSLSMSADVGAMFKLFYDKVRGVNVTLPAFKLPTMPAFDGVSFSFYLPDPMAAWAALTERGKCNCPEEFDQLWNAIRVLEKTLGLEPYPRPAAAEKKPTWNKHEGRIPGFGTRTDADVQMQPLPASNRLTDKYKHFLSLDPQEDDDVIEDAPAPASRRASRSNSQPLMRQRPVELLQLHQHPAMDNLRKYKSAPAPRLEGGGSGTSAVASLALAATVVLMAFVKSA